MVLWQTSALMAQIRVTRAKCTFPANHESALVPGVHGMAQQTSPLQQQQRPGEQISLSSAYAGRDLTHLLAYNTRIWMHQYTRKS